MALVGPMKYLTIGDSTYEIVSESGGDGTVTSVAVGNATNGGLSVSGSPITSSGTITIGHSNVLTSAQTTQAVYPIKIDKNGHISEYGNAVTIPDVSGKIDTAGSGLSKSGTTLNHSNSVTAQNTFGVYPIKIDAQGHISDYDSAITIPTQGTWYGTSSTTASTAAKVVTCSGFTLSAGAIIGVLFSTANTAATPTLNVNSTGATAIYVGNSTPSATTNVLKWSANTLVYFVYDGTYYRYITSVSAGSVTPSRGANTWYGTSSTGATTQAKTSTIDNFVLTKGAVAVITFSTANTYTSAKITLNINSTGAKDVYYNNAVTSSTNTLLWNAGETLTFIYNGTGYYFVGKNANKLSSFINDSGFITSADVPEGASAYTGTISAVTSGNSSTGTNNGFARGDHVHNITKSTVDSVLGTGSGTTKFYREDGSWQTPSVPTTAANSTTGITASTTATKTTLGTASTIYGVSSSTTTASKVTVGSHSTDYGVKSAGSGSFTQGSFSGGSFTQGTDSFTANTPTVIDTTKFNAGSYSHSGFSGGSGSFSATVTSHVLSFSHTHTAASYGTDSFTAPSLGTGFYTVGTAASFTQGEDSFTPATHGADSHTHTAPTLGSKVPTVSASDVTVPIKNSSSTSVPNVSVDSATVTITDTGHTHTLS